MTTDFSLLGEVGVRVDGHAVKLAPAHSAKVLAILAVLLRSPGTVISADALSDRVWGERPPEPATRYKYIGWLRSALAPYDVPLRNVTGGYVLSVDPGQVDLHRFRELILAARHAAAAGSGEKVSGLVRAALALWRGTALAGLSGSWIELFRDQLEREHREAAVLWAQTEMDLGRHAEALGQLAEWEAEWPTDEAIIALRMLALYRAGEPTWALACYERAAERVVRKFGAAPCHELGVLYTRIQARDRALSCDSGGAVSPSA